MPRRTTAFAALFVLIIGLLLGGSFAGASTPNDVACQRGITAPWNSAKVQQYNACRFDKIDAVVAGLSSSSPAPSPTPTAPPSASPTPAPTSASPTATPTSTPTATTGFPTAATTGVPAGTTLTPYTGPATITADGTVIDAKRITSCIVIKANNVTIRNSLLQSNGCYFNVLADNGNSNLQLVNIEVDGQGNGTGDSAINGSGWTCTRCNLHGTVDGVKAGSDVVLQDSYVHDLVISDDSHNDGVQSLGTTSLKVLRNRIVMANGATSAVILSTGSADAMRNVQIAGNLLGGGAFTVYGGYQAGTDTLSKVSNIAITGNQFTTSVFPRSGGYGPMTSTDSPVVVTGNTWADGAKQGQPVA